MDDMTAPLDTAILDLLGGRAGEPLTLDEIVHGLTVLRAAGRPGLPAITKRGVEAALQHLAGSGDVRQDDGRWERVYADMVKQGRLFDE
jgi:hypothetical protein